MRRRACLIRLRASDGRPNRNTGRDTLMLDQFVKVGTISIARQRRDEKDLNRGLRRLHGLLQPHQRYPRNPWSSPVSTTVLRDTKSRCRSGPHRPGRGVPQRGIRLRVAFGLQALQRCSGPLNRRARGSTVAAHHLGSVECRMADRFASHRVLHSSFFILHSAFKRLP